MYVQYDLEYYQEFSMNYKKPVYTGKKKKGYVLQAGNYYLLLKGKQKWQEYDTVTGARQLRITENFKFLFSLEPARITNIKQRLVLIQKKRRRKKPERNFRHF